MSVNLLTTQQTFERLHEQADSRAAHIKVETDAISKLLIDHSILVRALRSKGVSVIEPSALPKRRIK